MGWNYMGWNDMGFGMIGSVVFWIVIIAVLLYVFRGRGNDTTERPRSALDILNERYARGEIEKEEFDRKRRDLSG
ncbi:MAG: SHOCT domain-containing protein [Betaproteobacteria bacterium]|nr:SHOCT domain-containing protein [Betaproteobacteria bacterium]